MKEARGDDAVFCLVFSHDFDEAFDERWLPTLQVHVEAHVGQLAKKLVQAGDPIPLTLEWPPTQRVDEAVARIPALNLGQRGAPKPARHSGHARPILVVGSDHFAVSREVHVRFQRIGSELERATESRQGILRAFRGGSSVGIDDRQGRWIVP